MRRLRAGYFPVTACLFVMPLFADGARTLQVTTASLPNGTVGTLYAAGLAASGGSQPYSWSVASGRLPVGLLLVSDGTIAGIPLSAGSSSFTVSVTDSQRNSDQRLLAIAIAASVVIITGSLPDGQVGVAYSQTLQASGGTAPYTWSLMAGSLPAGITLSSAGQISGTPTAAGTSNFTVKVVDKNGSSTNQAFTLKIAAAPLTITTASLPSAQVGAAYSQTLQASGGTTPYSWSISAGSVPAGLTLTSAGVISGTPNAAGTANFTVKVTDANALSTTQALSVNVAAAPLTVTTTSLPDGQAGVAYSQTLQASGGVLPYTWAISAGSLPDGLTLAPTGQISGTPTTAITANFTVNVTDKNGLSAAQALTLKIAAAPVTIATTSLPDGQVGVAYSQTLQASGGTPPYKWSISAGALPDGLALTSAGQISGSPTTAGTANFTVKVTDKNAASATQALSLKIVPAPLTVTTTSLPDGQAGVAYSQTLQASGGTPPYTWSISAGALPDGVTLTSAGQISGSPTTATTASFTVKVTDKNAASATQALSLKIVPAPLTITTTSLPDGQVGVAYSQTLQASGGTPPYNWSISAGALPDGLTLTSAGQISGSPSTAGTANVTVKVTDKNAVSATQALSLKIVPAPLTITTTSLPDGQAGVAYSQTLQASGGTAPYNWSISAGALPDGLTLTSGGQISGSPTTATTANFTVKVTDKNAQSATQALSLKIAAAALVIATSSLPDGQVGVPYSQTLQVSGGTPPYAWSINGSLPSGITLNAQGQISGTPTTAGTSNFTVKVIDKNLISATQQLALNIAPPALAISTASLPDGQVGAAYSQTLQATGGSGSYTWSVSSGSLPAGLSLSSGGQIGGTPSTAGTANFTVKVTDTSSASATQALSIRIAAPGLSITTSSLPNGSAGAPYSQALQASGGTPPYSWSVASGALPGGLSLAGGQISGTPASPGSFAFTLKVTDSASMTASANFSITIIAGLVIASCPAGSATVGQPYSSSASASGGTPPLTWSVSGTLPSGIALDASSGGFSGTPSQAGSASFTLNASDSNSSTAAKSCSINVTAALLITTAALPNAATNVAFNQQMSASGGTPPYKWSLSGGSLPNGLSLSQSGAITGTPTTAGTYGFTVHVGDSAGLTADKSVTLVVINSLAIAACPASTGLVGQPYSSTAAAVGGQLPYTWAVSRGAVPNGLTLTSSSGALAGVPTDVGTFGYTLQVTDKTNATATLDCGITITANVRIVTGSLADASLNATYTQALSAAGGKPPYTWVLIGGALPPGLTLGANGVISGIPSQLGTSGFTVRVTDSTGAGAQQSYSINVLAGLIIGACPQQASELGFAYNSALVAEGGAQPYTWSIANGILPAGLSLNAKAGSVSGTLTQVGSSQFTVVVSDANNQTSNRQCVIDVRPALAVAAAGPLPPGSTGASYTATVAVTGGVAPYVWSTTGGSVPPGLALNAATGAISGTPVASGTFSFTVQVSDNIGAQVSKDLSITIAQGLAIPDCPTPTGAIGQPYSAALIALGGASPYKWSIGSGSLPAGLSLDSANALISGVPSQAGASNYVLRVDDASGNNATRGCSIQISSTALIISSAASLPNAAVGAAYSQTLGASGGVAPYSWSVAGAGAPAGLSLDPSGVLSGTPTAAGSFTFTIQVTDQAGNVARQNVTLNVLPGSVPNFTISGLTDIIDPAQQPGFNLQMDSTYPVEIDGTVTLTFTPDPAVGVDDPSIQFATGGRTLRFTVPPNASSATFAAPITALQTGTVAGTIQLTISLQTGGTDVTPSPAPSRTIRIDRRAPKISSMSVVTTASGFEVHIVGYSTTREVTQGTFQVFTNSGGAPLQVTVPMSDTGKAWFQSSQSTQFGGQFSLVQPFTLQGVSVGTLSSVSVTLSNAQGTSDAATAKF